MPLKIERATLLKLARDTATQYMAANPNLLSAYLTGSVAANEPLLGEATDIDLVFICRQAPATPREVVRLTDQVALDIQYRAQADYAAPKSLRVHPWRGPEMCEPVFLLDPRHVFELAQSSARGQFHRPDFVAARARTFVEWARNAAHLINLPGAEPSAPLTLRDWTVAVLNAANAVISLTGFPAANRRLLFKLERAATTLQRPELYAEAVALCGGETFDQSAAAKWLPTWRAAYVATQTSEAELIHPARLPIYERGFEAQLQADRATDMLWMVLATWVEMAPRLPADSPLNDELEQFLRRLRLSEADRARRVPDLRAYLNAVDDLVETWAEKNGA